MKKKAEVKIEVTDDSRTNEALIEQFDPLHFIMQQEGNHDDIFRLQEKVCLLSSVNVALIKLLKKIHPAWRADYDALLEKL